MSTLRQAEYEDVTVHCNRCPVCWNLCSLWQSACFVCDSRFSMTRVLVSGRTERLVSATSVAEVFSESAKLTDLTRNKVKKMALSTISSSTGGFHGAVHTIVKSAQRFQTSFFSPELDLEQRRSSAASARGGPYWFEAGFNSSWKYTSDPNGWSGHLLLGHIHEFMSRKLQDPIGSFW